MSIIQFLRQKIRKRAIFACEYCGVSETDTGGEMTIDHFQPQSKNGSDDEENLVYCCFRCNLYKSDYWAVESNQTSIFNPRSDNFKEHFWLSENGKLFGLTEIGEFTIKLLRLNRQPLITKREQNFQKIEEIQALKQSNEIVESLIKLTHQQRELLKEQQNLLEEQRLLIDYLFKK